MRLSPILILIALALSGCTNTSTTTTQNDPAQAKISITYQASAQTDAGLQRYVDPDGRYSISYPQTWLTAPSDVDGFDVFFVENSTDGSTVQSYFALSTQPSNIPLSRFGEYALQGVQDQPGLSNFSLITDQSITVNGINGLEHVMTYSISNVPADAAMQERDLAHRAAIIQDSAHTYSISLIVFQDQLQAYKPTFDAVLTSFQAQ